MVSAEKVQSKDHLWYCVQKGRSGAANHTILRNVISKAAKKYDKLILCGDFNSRIATNENQNLMKIKIIIIHSNQIIYI